MSHVALQLYEGRDLDTITQAESLEHFRELREDLDRITRGSSILEVVDHMTQEREPNAKLYTMLVGALRTLATQDHPLVVPAFFFKLLALEGFRPMVDACVICEQTDNLCAFDLDEGGVLCVDHRRGTAVTPEALDLLQAILGGRLSTRSRNRFRRRPSTWSTWRREPSSTTSNGACDRSASSTAADSYGAWTPLQTRALNDWSAGSLLSTVLVIGVPSTLNVPSCTWSGVSSVW